MVPLKPSLAETGSSVINNIVLAIGITMFELKEQLISESEIETLTLLGVPKDASMPGS